MYDEVAGGLGSGGRRIAGAGASRVQDRELMEMSDDGMCLSIHQPWASLLVMSIKIHEGRTWYTQYMGRRSSSFTTCTRAARTSCSPATTPPCACWAALT